MATLLYHLAAFCATMPSDTVTVRVSMRYENNAVKEQKIAYIGGDLEFAYGKFRQLNMLKKLTEEQKRALYDEMVEGTKAYLGDYK